MATLSKKSIIALAAIWGAWLCLSPATFAVDYDLVINGGRVMDPETNYDAVANVGIKDGRIAAITKNEITGKDTINAKGLVVAPGFIDTHFHSVDPFATKLVVADGVTTGMSKQRGPTPLVCSSGIVVAPVMASLRLRTERKSKTSPPLCLVASLWRKYGAMA